MKNKIESNNRSISEEAILKIETELPKKTSKGVSLVSFCTNGIDRRTMPLIKFNHVTLDYPREIAVPKADNTEKEYTLNIGLFSFVFLSLF